MYANPDFGWYGKGYQTKCISHGSYKKTKSNNDQLEFSGYAYTALQVNNNIEKESF